MTATSTKKIHTDAEVPQYSCILSGVDQQFPLGGELSRGLIVLEVPGSGTKGCAILVTKRLVDQNQVRSILLRCEKAGYRSRDVFESNESVIKALYEKHKNRGEGNADAETLLEDTELEKYFDALICDAVMKRASDIHFLPERERVKIAYRIHGDIYIQDTITHETASALINLMYGVLAESGSAKSSINLNTPQDAKICRRVEGLENEIELRYAHAPGFPVGTHVVLRLLGTGESLEVDQLGFEPGQVNQLDAIMSRASGIVVLAGTTGSGKSTTIKALIEDTLIKSDFKKIILTAEDPPEYQMNFANIVQSPVIRDDENDGKNPFAWMVTSMLRRDPDITVIGEIRDSQTAESAKDAVQSGHLTVCTVHAESALGIPGRLFSQGINRDVLGAPNFIAGLIYQKLLPVVCPDCSTPIAEALKRQQVSRALFSRIKVAAGKQLREIRFRGAGCKACAGIGTTHQTVCAEIVIPDHIITKSIGQGDDFGAFEHWLGKTEGAEGRGVTVMDHAIFKMKAGIVCPRDIESRIERLDMQASREGVGE